MGRVAATLFLFMFSFVPSVFATVSAVPAEAVNYVTYETSSAQAEIVDLTSSSSSESEAKIPVAVVDLAPEDVKPSNFESELEVVPDVTAELATAQLSEIVADETSASVTTTPTHSASSNLNDEVIDSAALSISDSEVCYELRIPELKVRETHLTTLPSAFNLQLTQNFREYIQSLIHEPIARREFVSLAPLRISLKAQTITNADLIRFLKTYAESADKHYVRELFCTAILPISEHLEFSAREAASFYYYLSHAFACTQQLDLALDALNMALSYAESDMYYNFYISLSEKMHLATADESYVAYADYLLRTKGPDAALATLETGLKKHTISRCVSNRIAAILNGLSPSDSSAFRR